MTIVDVMPKPPIEPTYLGDGVYASFDGFMIVLYTSDGITNSPPIYLEPSVYHALRTYGAKIWELKP